MDCLSGHLHTKTFLTKLKKLQNKAIEIIANTCPRKRVTPHYCKLNILKLNDLYQLELAQLMYQFSYNKLPSCYSNYFTYSFDSHYFYSMHNSN